MKWKGNHIYHWISLLSNKSSWLLRLPICHVLHLFYSPHSLKKKKKSAHMWLFNNTQTDYKRKPDRFQKYQISGPLPTGCAFMCRYLFREIMTHCGTDLAGVINQSLSWHISLCQDVFSLLTQLCFVLSAKLKFLFTAQQRTYCSCTPKWDCR